MKITRVFVISLLLVIALPCAVFAADNEDCGEIDFSTASEQILTEDEAATEEASEASGVESDETEQTSEVAPQEEESEDIVFVPVADDAQSINAAEPATEKPDIQKNIADPAIIASERLSEAIRSRKSEVIVRDLRIRDSDAMQEAILAEAVIADAESVTFIAEDGMLTEILIGYSDDESIEESSSANAHAQKEIPAREEAASPEVPPEAKTDIQPAQEDVTTTEDCEDVPSEQGDQVPPEPVQLASASVLLAALLKLLRIIF